MSLIWMADKLYDPQTSPAFQGYSHSDLGMSRTMSLNLRSYLAVLLDYATDQ